MAGGWKLKFTFYFMETSSFHSFISVPCLLCVIDLDILIGKEGIDKSCNTQWNFYVYYAHYQQEPEL
jgi:hypothetical protein